MDIKNSANADNTDFYKFYSQNINNYNQNKFNFKNSSFSSTPNVSSQNDKKENFNSDFDNIFNNIKSSTLENNYSNSNNYTNNENNNNDNSNLFNNIDLGTILKAKSILDKMNNTKQNPRSSLLYSLKPYLSKNKKDKLDEYIKIFNIADIFKNLNNGGDN